MIMMCLIVIFIIMLPIYTGKLVEVLSKRATPYEAEYSEPVSQFVVMGSFNYDGAVVLMRELLNNLADGGRSKILVMSTDPAPSEELKNFIDLAYFRSALFFLIYLFLFIYLFIYKLHLQNASRTYVGVPWWRMTCVAVTSLKPRPSSLSLPRQWTTACVSLRPLCRSIRPRLSTTHPRPLCLFSFTPTTSSPRA